MLVPFVFRKQVNTAEDGVKRRQWSWHVYSMSVGAGLRTVSKDILNQIGDVINIDVT